MLIVVGEIPGLLGVASPGGALLERFVGLVQSVQFWRLALWNILFAGLWLLQIPSIGGKTGTLNILSDDPASPRTVDLTCTGATPDIQIAGPPLADFGSQRINTVSATIRTFTISNPAGASTSSLTYNVTEASPHFSIACSAPGCSGTLAPGATAVTVTVSFRPTATGALTGTINVASNDVSTPSVNITVTCLLYTSPSPRD